MMNNMKVDFVFGQTISKEEMKENHIYLDGAVQGPVMDLERNSFSFDHHDGCIRHVTKATCEQVFQAIKLGFDPRGMTIVCNDIDADTVAAVWLLLNWNKIEHLSFLEREIDAFGKLDAHGPAYPVKVHNVYYKLRPKWGEEQTYNLLVEKINLLSEAFFNGMHQDESKREEKTFPAIFADIDGNIRTEEVKNFNDLYERGGVVGVIAFPGKNNTFGYTVGKKSEFVKFDVKHFLGRMNHEEPGWGGGSTIGGAPRYKNGERSSQPWRNIVDAFNKYY